MRVRKPVPFLLVLFALLVSWVPAQAEVAQSYCQWVCVDESCRLDRSPDNLCDVGPDVLQVSSDPDAAACLPEPLTMEMVSYTHSTSTAEGVSDPATVPGDDPAPGPAPGPAPPPPPPPPKQEVLITGFCKFGNLPENPTERILPALEKAVRDRCGADINLKSQCLNVNIQAIRKCTVEKRIVISLGVDAGKNEFRLETAAVNCYVDPFGKVKCDPVCIDPQKPITNTVQAPGPWPVLPQDPKIGTYPIVKGKPGTAGDYVCNATFYWLCTQKECKPYFIHTPNFGKDEDKDIIPGLAKLICDIIAANKPAAR
jgi:pyrrolidone-carboxylate peptidase